MRNAEKILVVEDDAIIVSLISSSLKSHGYLVTTTRTGKDALTKIQESHYNLVLLDIGLPDMMGTELLKKIRETDQNTVVIMITGHPQLDSSIDSVNYGADGYLVKPISNKELFEIIEEKLKKRFDRWVNNIFI